MSYSILCADDEGLILATIESLFAQTDDYAVHLANNGVEALMKVKEYHPDVVLLDINMPGMKGFEVLRLIHEIDESIVVIVISGYVSEEEARELLARGAYDYFKKPIELSRLYDTVEQLRIQNELS